MSAGTPRVLDDNDQFLVMLIGPLLLIQGLVVIGPMFAPVRSFLLNYGLLAAGDQVVIPLFDDLGLGWPAITVVACALVVTVVVITAAARRRRARL